MKSRKDIVLKLHIFIGSIITRIKWWDAGLYLSRSNDDEIRQIGTRIKSMPPVHFPYLFPNKYNDLKIESGIDDEGYPWVVDNGKKIYGKKQWTIEKMVDYYKSLLVEQDIESPHCYLCDENRYPDKGDVVVDLGAAEGIFTLRIIDDVSKAYLFECDKEWIVPLQKTFKLYLNKIEIINLLIGNETNETREIIKLDDYFGNLRYDYVKADIEGAEFCMLLGGVETLKKCKRILVCTYHNQDDYGKISELLKKMEFSVFTNNGYILYYAFIKKFKRPYIRRGVVFGKRERK